MKIRALTIAQRVQLLDEGLQDRSDDVRRSVLEMIRQWCVGANTETEKSASEQPNTIDEKGILALLQCVNVGDSEGEAAGVLVVQELYKSHMLQLPNINEVDMNSLTPEAAVLWRTMCICWKENQVLFQLPPLYGLLILFRILH